MTDVQVAGGAIHDVVVGPGGRRTPVRLRRCPAGWQASFEIVDPAAGASPVVHRLVAPTLREAKAAVPRAIGFLLGRPLEAFAMSLPAPESGRRPDLG